MTVLVGYVESPEGRAALDRGLDEAQLRGVPVEIVHAARAGLRNDPTEQIVEYKTKMQQLDEWLQKEGIEGRARQEIRSSEPADVLLDVASELPASLIVIGIRRRSPVGKLVMGSWAQQVLLGADCPVLAIKAQSS